jgi:hypothetical protein
MYGTIISNLQQDEAGRHDWLEYNNKEESENDKLESKSTPTAKANRMTEIN